jgi:hypothetical protein
VPIVQPLQARAAQAEPPRVEASTTDVREQSRDAEASPELPPTASDAANLAAPAAPAPRRAEPRASTVRAPVREGRWAAPDAPKLRKRALAPADVPTPASRGQVEPDSATSPGPTGTLDPRTDAAPELLAPASAPSAPPVSPEEPPRDRAEPADDFAPAGE